MDSINGNNNDWHTADIYVNVTHNVDDPSMAGKKGVIRNITVSFKFNFDVLRLCLKAVVRFYTRMLSETLLSVLKYDVVYVEFKF